jgi:hypothetical protein
MHYFLSSFISPCLRASVVKDSGFYGLALLGFFALDEAALFRLDEGAGGALAPFFRASDNPMATACFGFLTFLPLPPLFSLPSFIFFIACSTDFCACLP